MERFPKLASVPTSSEILGSPAPSLWDPQDKEESSKVCAMKAMGTYRASRTVLERGVEVGVHWEHVQSPYSALGGGEQSVGIFISARLSQRACRCSQHE